MLKFEYQFDENSEKVTMELPSGSLLPDVLEAFERFVRAATYSFKGHLDIVDEEENTNE